MVKVDLITGFLGAGKTTFLKLYAKHFLDMGQTIGILENDHGAVNIDMMLLQDLEGDNCELEMVSGGCDFDCHYRRFKTKLIAMGMCGYDRVIIEPSGIFNIDEFFDVLSEEPLNKWYEIGSVITLIDPEIDSLDQESLMLLSSQASSAGTVIISKLTSQNDPVCDEIINTVELNLKKIKCPHSLSDVVFKKPLNEFTSDDFDLISKSGYMPADYGSFTSLKEPSYENLYFMEENITVSNLTESIPSLFSDNSFGKIMRIKGFIKENDYWIQVNVTSSKTQLLPVRSGQAVIIVIGLELNEINIRKTLIKT